VTASILLTLPVVNAYSNSRSEAVSALLYVNCCDLLYVLFLMTFLFGSYSHGTRIGTSLVQPGTYCIVRLLAQLLTCLCNYLNRGKGKSQGSL
jgi:hypothetical protein